MNTDNGAKTFPECLGENRGALQDWDTAQLNKKVTPV